MVWTNKELILIVIKLLTFNTVQLIYTLTQLWLIPLNI